MVLKRGECDVIYKFIVWWEAKNILSINNVDPHQCQILICPFPSNLPLCQNVLDSTNLRLDVDSTDYERRTQTELDPIIQRDEKGPTIKEKREARAQFLALCWALCVVGWTDGSTGPLLPRIQVLYNVSGIFDPFLFNFPWISVGWVRNSVLGVYFAVSSQWCLLGLWC